VARHVVARLAAKRGLAPLHHRGFRLLTASQLASNVGDSCYAVALPWYVLAEHGGALLLGTVLVAYGIPRTVLLAAGGHASDRWRPWTVMMSTDAARAIGVGALAGAAALGPARAAVLVPIAAVPLLAGLSQRTWRDFGMTGGQPTAAASGARPVSAAADVLGGAS
jgi:hypothetical protein